MKIQKSELAQKLNKIKGVVPKKTTMPALQGILVRDGYLIANNMEMAVKAKIEGTDGEPFIIPERAFDLIASLPDGEVEVSPTGTDAIAITAEKIRNRYQTMDPGLFPEAPGQGGEGVQPTIRAEAFLESIRRVSYAIPARGNNAVMSSLFLQAGGRELNFAGLDGHMLAWDRVEYGGEFELLVPKETVDVLKSIGLSGELQIRHSLAGAAFITEEFEVYTRLVEGKYFNYQAMFKKLPMHTAVLRETLLEAVSRAKMCAQGKFPVRFRLEGDSLGLSVEGQTEEYHETVELQKGMQEPLEIGFNAKLVQETLKAFSCGEVSLSFGGPRMPMVVEDGNSSFQAIVLPVAKW